VAEVEREIETDVVFPLIRGREVGRWYTNRESYIVLGQNISNPSKAIPLNAFQNKFPKAASYFSIFEEQLRRRNGYIKYLEPTGEPFYAVYDVGKYTFAPYKVIWKYIAEELTCAVLSPQSDKVLGEKIIIPDHRLIMISLDNEIESHYVCAVLNSAISRFVVYGYVISTQIAPHVLENISVPQYDQTNEIHLSLARLSIKCHEKTAAGIDVSDLEEQIDNLSADLWGLTKQELIEIKESLQEMK